MFEEMVKYKEKYGDCLVPQKYGKLGGWVDRQRKRYKVTLSDKPQTTKAKLKELSAEQIEQLNGLGFVWQVKPTPKRKYDASDQTPEAAEGSIEDSNPSKKPKLETTDSTLVQPPQQAPVYPQPDIPGQAPAHYPPHEFDPNAPGQFYQSSDV